MLKYLVVYASESGNTKMIAEEIFKAIPSPSKDIVNIRQWTGKLDAETYFIGFWANHGSCSLEIIDLLSSLINKNIAIFGTCGMNNTEEYYKNIETNVRAWISDSNYYLGSYFCQGKMPALIREKYEKCRDKCDDQYIIDHMISMYEEGLQHPNRQDLLRANVFADTAIKNIPDDVNL